MGVRLIPKTEKMLSKKAIAKEVRRLTKLLRYGWRKETQNERDQVFGALTALEWALNGSDGGWVPVKPFDHKRNKRPLKFTVRRTKKGTEIRVPRLPTVL